MAAGGIGGKRGSTNPTKNRGYQDTNAPPQAPVPNWWQNIFKTGHEANMANYQNEYNKWMWDQENAYNTPKSQMDRFTDAGLSKNLMYERGTPGESSPGREAAKPDFSGMEGPMSMIDKYQEVQARSAQIRNIEANTDVTRNTADRGGLIAKLLEKKGQISQEELMALRGEVTTLWGSETGTSGSLGAKNIRSKSKIYENEVIKSKADAEVKSVLSSFAKTNQAFKWISLLSNLIK